MNPETQEAISILRQGSPIVIPTETTYGIIADPANSIAIQAVYELKNRPRNKPFSILFQNTQLVIEGKPQLNSISMRGLEKILNSGATAILPFKTDSTMFKLILPTLANPISKELVTIGVRIPQNPTSQALLKKCNGTLIATSVNKTGRPPINKAADILLLFPGIFILSKDEEVSGQASTIIDLSEATPKIIRQGSNLDKNTIAQILCE